MKSNFYLKVSCIFLICAVAGCATWVQHGVIARPEQKFRIAVLPVQTSVEIKKLSDIQTSSANVPNEKELIQEQIQKATEQLTRSLKSRLKGSPYFEVLSSQQADEASDIQKLDIPELWGTDELRKLGIGPDAQAVLLVTLSGYGKIKKKWITYLLGIGVVEAAVQGAIAAKLVDNIWVGIVIASEEIAQEYLIWGVGSDLYGRRYSPVTIEARLVSASDGKTIWEDTIFVSVDKKAIEALPEEERKKKEIQLKLTAEKAIAELVESLEKAAKKNLH